MTEHEGAPASTAGIDVVDPIRIPGASLAGGAWARLPLLGRVFVVLVLVDVVVRTFRLFGEGLGIDPAAPLTFVTAFLPHDALILLPAVLVARRADAAQATPLVLRGAVAVALVELLRWPLASLPFGAGGDSLMSWTVMTALATVVAGAGWVTISFGLAALNPQPARPSIDGFANLAAGTLIAGAAAWLLELVMGSHADPGDQSWSSMLLLASAVAPVQLVAWAFVARVAIRGLGDTRRPAITTALAAVAMVLAAISAALIVAEALLLAAQYLGILRSPVIAGMLGLGWLASGLVPTALVVAFGLGLADTSVRIPGDGAARATPIDPDVEPVRWPAPGGEVPEYRDPEPGPAPASPSTGPRRGKTRKPKEPHA